MNVRKVTAVSSIVALAAGLLTISGVAERHVPANVADTSLQALESSGTSTTASRGPRHLVPVAQALQTYPQLRSLPDGGIIVSTTTHKSWWVHFSGAPPATITRLLAHLGVGWGYSATPAFAKGADARLNPAAMTQAQLIRAGLPLPPSSAETSAYASWLTAVRALLPQLHVSDHVRAVVSPVKSWYNATIQYGNWAGYLNTQNTYAGIQAQFHMADTAYTLPTGQGVSQWVGLGGVNGSGLAQAGAARLNSGGVSGQDQSYLWVEAVYPSSGSNCFYYSTTHGFAPGDDIWSQVKFQGYTTINGTSYARYDAIALDGLNGVSTGWQSFACSGGFTNNTADSVLETPFQPDGTKSYYYTLPYFSTPAPFFNVYTYSSAGEANGEVAPYDLTELRSYLLPPGPNPKGPDPYGSSNATPTGWSSQTAFSVNYGTSQ